jgi:hypothetical protein
MIVIRQEQLKAFEKSLLDTFIDQSTTYAAQSWPDRAAEFPDRDGLRALVAKCIRRGRGLKFRDRGHLTRLLDWECRFGPDFAEKPEWDWLNTILTSDIDHASRIHRIENRLEVLRERGTI